MEPDHSSRNQNISNFMLHLPISMQMSIIIFVLNVNPTIKWISYKEWEYIKVWLLKTWITAPCEKVAHVTHTKET